MLASAVLAAQARPQPGTKLPLDQISVQMFHASAGRRLKPAGWPNGARVAVGLSFDVDHATAAIPGSSGFAELFAAQGPADRQGRSLRQLDLQDARSAVYVRLWDILSGHDTSPKYGRLSDADRRAVVDILRETLHDLPALFM